jgi:hypothetical protein
VVFAIARTQFDSLTRIVVFGNSRSVDGKVNRNDGIGWQQDCRSGRCATTADTSRTCGESAAHRGGENRFAGSGGGFGR